MVAGNAPYVAKIPVRCVISGSEVCLAHRLLALVAAGLLFGTCAQAQVPDAIDHYIRSEMQKLQIPGIALMVVRDG